MLCDQEESSVSQRNGVCAESLRKSSNLPSCLGRNSISERKANSINKKREK